MIRFKASIPYIVLGLFMTLAPNTYAQSSFSEQLQTALEAAVASPDTNFPGAILYVSQPDKGTWLGAAGVADIATNAALSPDAPFRAGSILKPFIAVTILQLVEEGKVSLETPMTKVLPDKYKALFPNAEEITVRMLLNHSSGLPEWDTPSVHEQIAANPTKVWKVSEFLGLAAAQRAYFAPGQGYHYSNTDYNLLGLILENVTGLSWRDAVMKRVIVPLGLQHTHLPAPGDSSLPDGFMHGYEMVDGHIVDLSLVDPSMADAAGGGALVTTVADLARFWAALREGELFQKEATLSEMMTFMDATDVGGLVGYGLGVEKYLLPGGLELIGHLGSTAGYRSFTGYFPSLELSLAMVINTPSDPTPVILAALDVVSPDVASSEQPDAGAALQGLLDDQVQKQGILGMVMAVRLADGTVVGKSSGYLDPDGKNTWEPDTQTALGSITKTFTAVVVMQLVQEGKLSLDDTIDTWFPDQPNGDKITVRMLLSHTSGLANYISGENNMDPKWAREWAPIDLVAEANKMGPVDEPGTKVAHYANTNYALLGLIIEKLTGNSWFQEIRTRIIEPLKLEHTTFLGEAGVWGGSMVEGYAKTESGYISSLEFPNYPHPSTTWAAGAVVSTLSDLMTFASALFDGQLVSKETLAIMATPVAPDDKDPRLWGLGGGTLESLPGGFGMGGDIPGYHAFFLGIQNTKLVVAALVNTEEGDVIGPSLMALEYLTSMSQGQPQQEPTPAAPEQSDPSAALQGLLDEQVQKQDIPGMIMAVRLPDGTVVSKSSGFTDPDGKNTWTMDTQSALGSITKTFTAVVIMQLVEEGKLSLDDTIDTWFTDQPNADKITVRMLLSHTSGLANFIRPYNERDPKWSKEWVPLELIAEANKMGPVDEPGSKTAHYANTNYFLLGLIIEKVTNNSWEQEVRSRIVEPLELKDTAFVGNKGVWGGTLVPGYTKTVNGYISNLEIPNLPHATTAWAAGGVVSTLSDLMTFASALFDGKLVSKESLAEMATPLGKDAESGRLWGLGGATLEELPSGFGMGGDAVGYHAFFVGVQDTKLVVAALVNTEEGDVVSPGLMALEYLHSLSLSQ